MRERPGTKREVMGIREAMACTRALLDAEATRERRSWAMGYSSLSRGSVTPSPRKADP